MVAAKKTEEVVTIKAPNFEILSIKIKGVAPLCQARFSKKAELMANMQDTTTKSKKQRVARDYDKDMRDALHVSTEGWYGIPASAFRNAAIDVCRMVGFKMTHAKMSVFIEADGFDLHEGQPLVRLLVGEPERLDMATRNANGSVDVRSRPMWRDWGAVVRVRFDADQFKRSDVVNLISRAGMQVGVGEGRPFSKSSAGMGFGMFEVEAYTE